jgi:serpin B
MKRTSGMAVLLVLAALLHQCADRIFDPVEVREKRDLTSFEKQLVQSGNEFGIELFKKINEFGQDKNIFISPLSVSVALGMTLNGAGGSTFDAMRSTLAFEDMTQEQINESYQSLIELLTGLDPKVKFSLANSIWYRNDFQVEEDFVNTNKTYFDALVRQLNFASPDAVKTINGWIEDKTNGKIKKMIERIAPNVVMFLINAIYFKGTWTYEFDKDLTKDDQFTKQDGATVPVRMMAQEGDFNYFGDIGLQAIELPYGDGDFSMILLLPRGDKSIEDLTDQISVEKLNEWTERLRQQKVGGILEMPRFTFEYGSSLKEVLSALGMSIAFNPGQANFTRINKGGGLWIDDVLHKAFVEVNEEGTEAAAASVVVIVVSAGGHLLMRLDRPFLFIIQENRSDTILFMGKVMEPKV